MSRAVSAKLRREVAERAYHVCEYCLVHEDNSFWGFEVDHIISRKHGGPTLLDNTAWACVFCNNGKGTDLGTLIGQPLKLVRLFHPRQDRWAACFQLVGVRL